MTSLREHDEDRAAEASGIIRDNISTAVASAAPKIVAKVIGSLVADLVCNTPTASSYKDTPQPGRDDVFINAYKASQTATKPVVVAKPAAKPKPIVKSQLKLRAKPVAKPVVKPVVVAKPAAKVVITPPKPNSSSIVVRTGIPIHLSGSPKVIIDTFIEDATDLLKWTGIKNLISPSEPTLTIHTCGGPVQAIRTGQTSFKVPSLSQYPLDVQKKVVAAGEALIAERRKVLNNVDAADIKYNDMFGQWRSRRPLKKYDSYGQPNKEPSTASFQELLKALGGGK